jgi:hypothetical protein
MNRIKVIDRLETEDGNFIELTHNSADIGRVYRVEIKTGFGTRWDEWFTTLDSELNERLARETYAELKEQIKRKVMA